MEVLNGGWKGQVELENGLGCECGDGDFDGCLRVVVGISEVEAVVEVRSFSFLMVAGVNGEIPRLGASPHDAVVQDW